MDREPQDAPQHESTEDEGIPDPGRPLPGKVKTGDPQEGIMVPRDEPRGAEDFGTTAAEQRDEEPLGDRLDEERPDVEPGGRRRAGRLLDEGAVDEEKDLVGDAAGEEEGLSAEESAVRVERSPGGLTDHADDYVEDDTTGG